MVYGMERAGRGNGQERGREQSHSGMEKGPLRQTLLIVWSSSPLISRSNGTLEWDLGGPAQPTQTLHPKQIIPLSCNLLICKTEHRHTSLLLRFTDVACFTNQRQDPPQQKKDFPSLYCNTCFITVVWTRTRSTSQVCLCGPDQRCPVEI